MNSQELQELQRAYLNVYINEEIINYLVCEGYANTPESAYIIMENMSEDWKSNIKSVLKTTANVAGRVAAGTADVVGSTARGVVGKKTTSKNSLSKAANVAGRAANATGRAASKLISKSDLAKRVRRFAKNTTLGLVTGGILR